MSRIRTRALEPGDLPVAGRIIYRAFANGFRRHGYAEPVADSRAGAALAAAALAADPAGGLLLELANGRPIAIAFYQQCETDVYIGPVAVEPDVQGMGYGRQLMDEVIARCGQRSARLLQDAFNPVSYRLYARHGFAVRESLVLLVTPPRGPDPVPFGPDETGAEKRVWSLRDTTPADLSLLAKLDAEAGGVEREALIERVAPRMRGVILDGKRAPRGFACAFPGSGIWVVGPGWASDGRTLAAIVVGLAERCVQDREAVALFAPASRVDLVQPLLDVGFRVSHLVNLMVRGAFSPFEGAHLPVLPVDTATVW